ncbi:MAG TPA: hypothetical protein VFJ58_12770, partial [Armatimonadota bacterium]|nr:hypothetical protein [Armatimonadota bacterium]
NLVHVYGQYSVGKASGEDLARAAVDCAGSAANAAMMVDGVGEVEEAGKLGEEGVDCLEEGGGADAPAPSLGILEGKSATVSQKGLDIVKAHLAQFGSFPENEAMIARLQAAMEAGERVSGADLSFYMHELAESTLMKGGMVYEDAHEAALAKYDVSRFSVYHPDVIAANPASFGDVWRNAWGLSR